MCFKKKFVFRYSPVSRVGKNKSWGNRARRYKGGKVRNTRYSCYDEINERPTRLPKEKRLEWWNDRHRGKRDNCWKTWRKFQCRNVKSKEKLNELEINDFESVDCDYLLCSASDY